MTSMFDHENISPKLTEDILRKVNALGNQPRVVIELDKMVYVPGVKSNFEVWERFYSSMVESVSSNSVVTSPLELEPLPISSNATSGERFEYIKCAFDKWCKQYGLDKQAYYFLLAVCNHETGFGTLGMGRKEKGSFIVGYGCPSNCDQTYSGIDTQAKYATKRYYEAMKSRLNAISMRGYLTENDVDYFHEGGDKGYGRWVWSADGQNWKQKVKGYYDTIRLEGGAKWDCNSSINAQSTCSDCDTYTVFDQMATMQSTSTEPITFPVEGINFSNGAYVSSHHMNQPGGRKGHKGIDIVAQGGINGKWAVAAWSGVVDRAYYSTSYGNCVMIKHNNGYYTVYAHLQNNSIIVRQGQKVNAGQRLGRVGSTGNSTGPHLHFEIWKDKWEYGGNNHINPYPVLTGSQQLNVNPTGQVKEMTITPNIKFNKCFDKDAQLDSNWIDKNNVKHFTVVSTGEKYLGFNGSSDKVTSFGYKHNFSADGYFEYSFYLNLKEGDELVVSFDGMIVKRYTSSDNTLNATYEAPIYVRFSGTGENGVDSHVLDFTLFNNSGSAVFGLKCFKVVEVDIVHGYVADTIIQRKRNFQLETGAFVYDDTFTLEEDILDWEVNEHFDALTSTAKFTLDNKYGIYSPSYRREPIFPDNLRESEMSYFDGDSVRHVLSEGTPVRIYAGYGDNIVRVFTGRIKGEIEEDSETRTVTINCVGMYDMLEEFVFDRKVTYPDVEEIHGDEVKPNALWVKSSIVHNIVNRAGLIGWRVHEDDLRYPDAIIEETYYIDIDKGGVVATVWDAKTQQYVEKKISSVRDIEGYRNPYVQSAEFEAGTRGSDAIQEIIGDILYRAYCDRYGTFRLENIRNINAKNAKHEFIDGENLISLTTSIDHSRVRNHLVVEGSSGQTEHFIDKDLFIATKGIPRTARISAPWIDESYGTSSRGIKEEVARKAFFDMKRMARTFNVVVKGDPTIDVLDGVYIYDRNTSTAGYYVVKGNRLQGNKDGMVNYLELTWEDVESYNARG